MPRRTTTARGVDDRSIVFFRKTKRRGTKNRAERERRARRDRDDDYHHRGSLSAFTLLRAHEEEASETITTLSPLLLRDRNAPYLNSCHAWAAAAAPPLPLPSSRRGLHCRGRPASTAAAPPPPPARRTCASRRCARAAARARAASRRSPQRNLRPGRRSETAPRLEDGSDRRRHRAFSARFIE